MRYHSSYRRQHSAAGFGMVELMVSIGIMVLVTTVMVARQSAFNGAVLLRNQAYEIAFTIRQAQLLAVSGGDAAVRQYGVYFNTGSDTQHEYILFSDANGNGRYDSGEQIGLTGRIDDRFEVRNLHVGTTAYNPLTVVFERPNFDAKFYENATQRNGSNAYVTIARTGVSGNGTGDARRVQVTSTGQISVITF